MNILSVQNYNLSSFAPQKIQKQNQHARTFGLFMQRPLSKDTVSFGNKKFTNLDQKRLTRLGKTYLDMLSSICETGKKEYNLSFDRKMCEDHVIKSPESFISKTMRAPDGVVLDRIRATIYSKNIYDMNTLFKYILPELADRGFVPCKKEIELTEGKKINGKIVNKIDVDDISIRINKDKIKNLPFDYNYAIDGAQPSGMQDIQLHLIRDFDPKTEPVIHELLISFGPEYHKAYIAEHSDVYEKTREFKKLGILKDTDNEDFIQSANRHIDGIIKIFKNELSSKLYENAENKDLYEIEIENAIRFSPSCIETFEKYFKGLHGVVTAYYQSLTNKCPEQANMYKGRLLSDRKKINEIKKGLSETIQKYNNLYRKTKATSNKKTAKS